MAYKKSDLTEQSLKVIKDHSLVFIDEIFTYVQFSSATFYNHELEKLEPITKALADNKIKTKIKLRKQWSDSKSPVLQIALYKLLASADEYERLIQQKIDHTSGGDKISLPFDIAIESRKKINPE